MKSGQLAGGGAPEPGGGPSGGACGGGDWFGQSPGEAMNAPPTRVQVTPHPSGTTAGASAVAIRVAIIPVTIVGRIRCEASFSADPPNARRTIPGRFAKASAILCSGPSLTKTVDLYRN